MVLDVLNDCLLDFELAFSAVFDPFWVPNKLASFLLGHLALLVSSKGFLACAVC